MDRVIRVIPTFGTYLGVTHGQMGYKPANRKIFQPVGWPG
jgi:hypothetical protein